MKNVFVAGHNGMVGSALVRELQSSSGLDVNLILKDRASLNLLDQREVLDFFMNSEIDHVYLAAAKVGGIYANSTYPAEFIYENMMIELNIIHACYQAGIKKLLFLGSSCIYPKFSEQPIKEEFLLSGRLEPTNEPYAIAKIAGIKLCESYNRQYGDVSGLDYRCAMPTNLFGIGDNYHPDNSHVIPALIRRVHLAKKNSLSTVDIWGAGSVRREFLFSDDLAKACVFLMNIDLDLYYSVASPMCSHINIGSGGDQTIKELAEAICKAVGYEGTLVFDTSKPEGTPRKLLDSSKINSLGWEAGTTLECGLAKAYKDYLETLEYKIK